MKTLGKIKLAPIFADGAVLQANKPIRIFGEGEGELTARFLGEEKSLLAGGRFCLELSPRDYGGPYELELSSGCESLTLKNIFVGEVLLLAGQSNIAFKLKSSSYPPERYENEPMLRCFCGGIYGDEHTFAPEDGWVGCEGERVAEFSAIGYHLGLEICKTRGVAVGLLASYLGSSVIESWMPRELTDKPEFYLPPEEKYDSPYVRGEHNEKGRLYAIKQQPLTPYSVGNAIWYQGESNSGPSEHKIYADLLAELIACWRRDFRDPKLPFTVIQIADRDTRNDAAWHGIQAAQARVAELVDGVFVVRSADVCESDDIHPKTKHLLAHRIYESLVDNELI